jgi:hypothetical protein
LAAKHDTIVPVYVAGDAANHAATDSASPEYIIRPFVFVPASLPPINHRLYPPPTQSDAYTHAICEVFGLLTPFRQLNPSFEKYAFRVVLAASPPPTKNRVRALFIARENAPLLATVIPVPPFASVSLVPGTRAQEAPPSDEYISPVCCDALSVMALVRMN